MVRLSYLSALEFKGSDAGQFLQSQLSADILAIPEGLSGFGCLCNPDGRVTGLMLVKPAAASYLVICAAQLAGALASHLGKYVLRSDVAIRQRPGWLVSGVVEPTTAGAGFKLFRHPTGLTYGVSGTETAAPTAAGPAQARWKARELRSGIAWLGNASSGRFLPQMMGAVSIGALSFSKGCYPGQEIIARTRYLGKLKRHPLVAEVGADLSPAVLDEVVLRSGSGEFKAVVVDHARPQDGLSVLYLVARAEDFPKAARLVWNGAEFDASLAPPGKIPGRAQG